MKLATIQVSVFREALKFEDYKVKIECIQQSDVADDDRNEFLKPMADYIAQLIIEEKKIDY